MGTLMASHAEKIPSDIALTLREIQCLQGLAQGMSNRDIAEHLAITLPTVALHIANARRRLGAQTREQAVAIAVARHMVEADIGIPNSAT
jgi:DNA-binding CsgD family transcriptional regulator